MSAIKQHNKNVPDTSSKPRLSGHPREDKTPSESKRRTQSKLSMIDHSTSRILFTHRRGDRFKTPRYQNTYRLEPFRPFHFETVDKIVRDIMESKLSTMTSYDVDHISKLSMEILSDVIRIIERKDYDRCKVAAQVTIIQRLHQSIYAAFECLWDPDRDNYSYYVFQNSYVYAWCIVFGLYYE